MPRARASDGLDGVLFLDNVRVKMTLRSYEKWVLVTDKVNGLFHIRSQKPTILVDRLEKKVHYARSNRSVRYI